MPVTVTIDDKLPFRTGRDQTLYARIGLDHSVWGPLIEKAFSKYLGSYETVIGGVPSFALQILAGSPGYSITHRDVSKDDLWDILSKEDKTTAMITLACPTSTKEGLVGMHAYSFIKVVELSNGVRLV